MSLKDLRLASGHSQQTIASILNVDQATVSRWESGLTKPWKKYRKQLACILNVKPETLEEILKENE